LLGTKHACSLLTARVTVSVLGANNSTLIAYSYISG